MGRKINCYPFCRPLLKATVHYNVGRVFCESSFRFFATQLDVLIIPRLIAWCVPPSPPERWPKKKNVQHQWFNDLNHQQKKILWQFVALMKHKPTVLPFPIYPHHFSLSGPSVFFEAEKNNSTFRHGTLCGSRTGVSLWKTQRRPSNPWMPTALESTFFLSGSFRHQNGPHGKEDDYMCLYVNMSYTLVFA